MAKVLIVDDEKATREGLKEFIPWKSLGVDEVHDACDGINALEVALDVKPEIILCDVRMPRMDGIELATILKEKLPDIKIIFLSGYSDKEYLKSAIQLNAVDYVEKPVNINEVAAAIKKTVEICREESEKRAAESEMRLMLEESLPLLHQKLALDLLSSRIKLPEIKKKFLTAGLDFPISGFYTTVLVKLNLAAGYSPEHRQACIDCLLEAIEQELQKASFKYISGLKDEEYVIIHISERSTSERHLYRTVLTDILERSDEILPDENRVFISVGKRVRGIEYIYESYQTAVVFLQKQFYIGYRHVVIYEEASDRIYTHAAELSERFVELLKTAKKTEAIELVSRMTDNIKRHDNTLINYVKNIYLNLVLDLSKVAEERNIKLTDHDNEKEFFWDEISKAGTLSEIEEYLIQKIELMFRFIEEKENKGNAVFNILRYIHENFHDKDLSIKTIAEYTYLTPTYLCLIFKKETGKTINQYITELRIQKSKEFLKDRKAKIYEIASKVGYSDANYYAKVFEKYVGLNPSDYREKYLV